MVGETSGVQYPWLKDLDRAMFLLGELGPIEAAKILNDPRDWAAFCDRHRLELDDTDALMLRELFRA
jgi:uncharacterized protein YeaO (DUF488 family)